MLYTIIYNNYTNYYKHDTTIYYNYSNYYKHDTTIYYNYSNYYKHDIFLKTTITCLQKYYLSRPQHRNLDQLLLCFFSFLLPIFFGFFFWGFPMSVSTSLYLALLSIIIASRTYIGCHDSESAVPK